MRFCFNISIIWSFVLCTSVVNGQDEAAQKSIDSLQALIDVETVDTLKYQHYRELTDRLSLVDRAATIEPYKKKLALAETIGNDEQIAASLQELSSNFLYIGNTDSAYSYLTRAISLYENLNNLPALNDNLNNLALLYQRTNRYEEATKTYHQTLIYSDSLNDNVGKVYTYINLMSVSMDQDDERKALEYLSSLEEVAKLFPQMNEDDVREVQGLFSAVYLNAGICYNENHLNILDSAQLYFVKASNNLVYVDDDFTKSYYGGYIDNSLGEIFNAIGSSFGLGERANKDSVIHFHNLALDNFTKANDAFNKLEDSRGIAFTLVNKGKVLNELGRFESAKENLLEALSLAEEIDFKEEIRDSYEHLADNAKLTGDYAKESEYLRKWVKFKEEIRNEERDNAQKLLEVKYETAKNEQKLLIANQEKTDAAYKLTLRSYLYALSMLLLIGLSYAIFARLRFNKQKEKTNYEKEMNQAMSRFVPMGFINAIGCEKITDIKLGDQVEKEVTVVFTDIRSFTTISEDMTPSENFAFVKEYAERMGPIIERNKGFISQYLGDGIMAIFQSEPSDALHACIQMQDDIKEYNKILKSRKRAPIKVGMGMHTGPLIMGIIGDDSRWDATLISDTVNTAARIENTTKEYKADILLSNDVYERISNIDGHKLDLIGEVSVKGKTKPVEIYECRKSIELNDIKEVSKAYSEI